jgi:hypothetical protein
VCAKLREGGKDPCPQLERAAVGAVTYRDFSVQPEQDILSDSDVAAVHVEYLGLLTDCLVQAVKRGELDTGARLELSWTITNQGRAEGLGSAPPIDQQPVEACLRRALELFRYPPYRGERRNLTLPLAVE